MFLDRTFYRSSTYKICKHKMFVFIDAVLNGPCPQGFYGLSLLINHFVFIIVLNVLRGDLRNKRNFKPNIPCWIYASWTFLIYFYCFCLHYKNYTCIVAQKIFFFISENFLSVENLEYIFIKSVLKSVFAYCVFSVDLKMESFYWLVDESGGGKSWNL